MSRRPIVRRLESDYWHVRWSGEVWAQWPIGRPVREDDFFHASTTYSAARAAEANHLTGEVSR